MRAKTGKSAEIVKPQDWWVQAFSQSPKTDESYPTPACDYAEHRFLAFLVILLQLERKKAKKRVETVRVFSYDGSLETEATGIQKNRVSSYTGMRPRSYHFYEETYLLLTGQLAGTIAEVGQYNAYRKRGKKLTTVTAIRPLHPHTEIAHNLELERRLVDGRSDIRKEPKLVHVIKLLERTKKLIGKRGYIPALIYILEQLGLEHNAATIRYNGKQ